MAISADPLRGLGYISSLHITAYEDQYGDTKIDEMDVPYDPESFKVTNKVELKKPAIMGAGKGNITYSGAGETKFSVHLLFDDCTLPTVEECYVMAAADYDVAIADSVENQLKKFYKICYAQNSGTKAPNYLSINSGSMPIMEDVSGEFQCLMESIEVKTNLVSVSTGQRLKVTVECSFLDSSPYISK